MGWAMTTKKANAVKRTNAHSMRKSFTAVLEPDGTALKWTIARVPFEMAKTWPVRKGRRVRGEIEGFGFRTTLFPDPRATAGTKGHLLLVNKTMQAGAGARKGDKVRIWLEPDLEEREIKLPVELERELKSERRLWKWFGELSDARRREIGKWADEPKGKESRENRAAKMAERLMQAMEGEKDPPPVLKAAFQRQPLARGAWMALTEVQRRNHLLGIFYYETADGRERRAAKAIEEAMKKAGNKGTRG
jgi:uncharacterized protein YdeI (YjbR/CyaY-like superfamily)